MPRSLVLGTGGLWAEQQFCFELGYIEGVANTRKAIREALERKESLKCIL